MQGTLGDSIQGYAAIMTHSAPDDYVGDHDVDATFDQVVLAGAVDAAAFIPTLVVGSRSGWEPLPGEQLQEIPTESSEVSKRHRIWTGPETSENRVRQLLSPVMVDWLASVDVGGVRFRARQGLVLRIRAPLRVHPVRLARQAGGARLVDGHGGRPGQADSGRGGPGVRRRGAWSVRSTGLSSWC